MQVTNMQGLGTRLHMARVLTLQRLLNSELLLLTSAVCELTTWFIIATIALVTQTSHIGEHCTLNIALDYITLEYYIYNYVHQLQDCS